MGSMSEQERQSAIRLRLARSQERASGVLPTGFATLDDAIGGGLPRASIVELYGPSGTGKTTLAFQIVAHAQRQGATAAWIDAEHVFDAPYAAGLGVVVEAMPLAQPDSAEQALDIACHLAGSFAVDLLTIDSAAALVPRMELESGMGEGGAGLQSRVLASGLKKLSHVAGKTGTVVLFLNQTRSRRHATGGESQSSAGGAPLKLYSALRLALGPQSGDGVAFRILKNKGAEAFREGRLQCGADGKFTKSP